MIITIVGESCSGKGQLVSLLLKQRSLERIRFGLEPDGSAVALLDANHRKMKSRELSAEWLALDENMHLEETLQSYRYVIHKWQHATRRYPLVWSSQLSHIPQRVIVVCPTFAELQDRRKERCTTETKVPEHEYKESYSLVVLPSVVAYLQAGIRVEMVRASSETKYTDIDIDSDPGN